ncbi:putative capsular polysaccharide synthesis family protein [Paenibacillus thermotolerans]|uniref:putative capsular polysaccharide synthesis family protein n=1 Tax=Paenibacillus thermotolerans TaxID=3027807 RepID=UPI002368ECB6|nr:MULTISPECIES: putative capsular polysaccharide synthesis family protein [unclassified Paenibacillus]
MVYKIIKSIKELLGVLLKKEIVLVYTMGKVGTTTIEATLEAHSVSPVIHIHQLNFKRENDRKKKSLYDIKSYIISLFLKMARKNKKIKIITVVRDPIQRNMSSFFQIIDKHDRDILNKGNNDVNFLIRHFFENYMHDYPLTWFDKELKAVFGYDVYNSNFDKEKGYIISKADNVEILVFKMEKIKEIGIEALNKFMNLKISVLVNRNEANEKQYHDLYKDFKSKIIFEKDFVDKIYNSKFTKHFYSDKEIEENVLKLKIS